MCSISWSPTIFTILHQISNSVVPSICISWHSITRKSYPSPYLLFYLFITLLQAGHWFLLYSLGCCHIYYNMYCIFILLLTLFYWKGKAPSSWLLCLFAVAHHSLISCDHHFLLRQAAPNVSCLLPAPTPKSAITPKSPGSFCWRNCTQKPTYDYWVSSLLLGAGGGVIV